MQTKLAPAFVRCYNTPQRRPFRKHLRNRCCPPTYIQFFREGQKFMYKLSARQILLIALISGLFAAAGVVILDRINNRFEPSQAAYSETAPAGITDPSTATDEQNNIEV